MNNNSSHSDSDNQDGGQMSPDSIIRTVAYCIIFVLGLVGNVFVLFALKGKKRRTANDWFILNLTISDLLLIVCVISGVNVEVARSPYNLLFCKVLRPLATLVFFVSIFTITSMALERHQVITKPFHPKMEKKSLLLVIGGIWVLAVIFVIPLPIVTSAGINECEEDWSAIIYRNIYTVILVVFQYLLPLVIISAAYTRIIVFLWNERSSGRALNMRGNTGLRKARKENIQVVKAVIAVVTFFAVCMLPGQIAWLLWEFKRVKPQNIAQHLLQFSPIMSYLHSCANPIIYGTFMAYFRQEFKLWLAKCCNGINHVWKSRKSIHSVQVSSAHEEEHQPNDNVVNNDVVSGNKETPPEGEMQDVTHHKDVLDTENGAKRNSAYVKDESVENEPDFDETHF